MKVRTALRWFILLMMGTVPAVAFAGAAVGTACHEKTETIEVDAALAPEVVKEFRINGDRQPACRYALVLEGEVLLPRAEGLISTTLDGVVNSHAAVKVFIERLKAGGPGSLENPSNWEKRNSGMIQPGKKEAFRGSNFVDLGPGETLAPWPVTIRVGTTPLSGTLNPEVHLNRIQLIATRHASDPLTFPGVPENVVLRSNTNSSLTFTVHSTRSELKTVPVKLRFERRTGTGNLPKEVLAVATFDSHGFGKARFDIRPDAVGSYIGQLSIDLYNRPQIPFGLQIGKTQRANLLRGPLIALGMFLLVGSLLAKSRQHRR